MMVASVLKSLFVLTSLLPVNAPSGETAVAPNWATQSVAEAGERLAGSIRPEVRLRKLHLVRPDLIPYPIAYEVYC